MTSPRAVLVIVVLACLPLAACGGEDEDQGQQRAAGQNPVANGPAVWPLTGQETEGDASPRRRPVLGVKVDNTASSEPQVGLDSADLVVEELVEGGATRLAAFFHSGYPDEVGPVRSVRKTDVGVAAPVDASLVTSGGARVTLGQLKQAGIPVLGEKTPGFRRAPSRTAPYDLVVDLGTVAEQAPESDPPSSGYLAWGAAEDLPRDQRASAMQVRFSAGHTTSWRYADGRYLRQGSHAAPDERFAADTVLALKVPVTSAGYRDPAGNPVPVSRLAGSGEAWLFHGGRMVRATWTKDGLDGQLRLRADGQQIPVPVGRTWVELVPRKDGAVTVG